MIAIFQSLLVYITLMIMMMGFGYLASRKKNYYISESGVIRYRNFWHLDTILPLIIFAIVFGMRYDVGTDHLTYLEGYLSNRYVGKNEILFFLISDIGWFFNWHYTVYFGILAFIQVFFFFYAFKEYRYLYPLLVFFLFVCGTVFLWMNVIRQAIAMCIWICSLRYIEEKNLMKYFIYGFIAVLFHKSAVILFIFYPVLSSGRDYFKSIPIQLILILVSFAVQRVFSELILRFESIINFYISVLGADSYGSYQIERLINDFAEQEGTGIAYLFNICVNITVILFSTKLKRYYNSKWFNIMYFFFMLGLVTTYMFPVGAFSITRPFRYFYVFQPILYAYFSYYLYKNRRDGRKFLLLLILMIAYSGILILSQYNASVDSHVLYQFYFQNNVRGYPN